MDHFKDAHYFYIPSQGNVYTMTDLKLANGSTKLLVASLKREVFCFEYQDSPTGSLVPTTKEISFTYIPNGAEIISLDAFNKSSTTNEFVIGITIIKNSNESDSLEAYLNIYSEWEENEDFNIENIAQNCLNVELNFIPYKLLHSFLVKWQDDECVTKEFVFILSGSDHQVHVYREHTLEHVYKEIDNKDFFPEFTKAPSPIIWIDVYYSEDYTERITSYACECGYIKLLKVDTKKNQVVYNFSTRFGNYISRVQIFPEDDGMSNFTFEMNGNVKRIGRDEKPVSHSKSIPNKINLVVINTILPAVIFHNVLEFGLTDYATLPRHDSTSILTCCEIADIDFDGRKEILIGNSAEEIMLLKHIEQKGWCLEDLKKIAAPVLGLKYLDVSGDGVKELVVLGMKGVHVLQHDSSYLQRVLHTKIQKLTLPDLEEIKT
ncbi:KICSTOR complex protein kaptin-like [Anoplophora glabripennis]|uniref:KICSTOR complex protein kaptin-like n=1 Tax=Anoplophora glabripennis TaxID=217634 RepID=UPI000875A655|nr:KICSTOR complex protein kaptin-like [Anoplophora glabripennis]